MTDDVIKLISNTFTPDEEGNQIPNQDPRLVMCKVGSVSRSEYYSAAQVGLHPTFIFVLSDALDYQGEQKLKYYWNGRERTYDITRTYKREDGSLEITAQERLGNGG